MTTKRCALKSFTIVANLTEKDEDELLEIDEAKASDATPSNDELMMNILTQMSANLNTASESLKHLRQSNSITADDAVPAKKAKPAAEVTNSPTRPIQGQKTANKTKVRMVYLTK